MKRRITRKTIYFFVFTQPLDVMAGFVPAVHAAARSDKLWSIAQNL
jgi:hypothetical protein